MAYTQQTCSILQVKRLNDWEKSRELRRSGAASRLHMLNHSGEWSSDAIELALAHKDAVRATYHPGVHWAERLEMAAWWGDYLDTLRTGAKILPLVRNQ